ncbi:MAG: hypothetical protein ACRDFS_05545 [Chloroflexota bacterium]
MDPMSRGAPPLIAHDESAWGGLKDGTVLGTAARGLGHQTKEIEMDFTLLLYPLVFAGVFKIVGGIIAVVVAIPFIIGLVVGWLVGRAM